MPSKRITSKEFAKLASRQGYGVEPAFKKRATNVETRNTGDRAYVESIVGKKLEDSAQVQIGVAGTVRVRVTFYRTRLADYSRAISEKVWVDCAVYAGLIANDSEREICYEDGGQHKVATKSEERIEMEFFYPEVDYDNLWIPKPKKVKK